MYDYDYENDLEIVIKYDQIFTPHPLVCSTKTYTSFQEMWNDIGEELDKAREEAYENNASFTIYTCKCVPKPEYRKELTYYE